MEYESKEIWQMTSNQKRFIEELKRKIDHLDPPLIAEEGMILTHQIDKDGKYMRVDIRHRQEKEFDLWVAVYDSEIIVFFSVAHEHFNLPEEDNESDEWILDAIMFITNILEGRYEIESVYKGNKVVATRVYCVEEGKQREEIGYSIYFSLTLLNPFKISRIESKRISFINKI